MYYDIYILSYLMEAPRYGYEIKKKFSDTISACTAISNNTLYPILRKYEKMGATVRRAEHTEGGQERFVYTITDAGRKVFVDLLCNFPDSLMNNREEFCVRLSFFPCLRKEVRQRVLTLRENHLRISREKLQQMYDREPRPAEHSLKMIDFTASIVESEEELIRYFKSRIDEKCTLDENGFYI